MVDICTNIDPIIITRVFEKYVTKSLTGISLGLFISKSIVDTLYLFVYLLYSDMYYITLGYCKGIHNRFGR